MEISVNYLRQVGEEKKQRKGEAKNKAVGPGASNRGHGMAPFAPHPHHTAAPHNMEAAKLHS